ncbi:MAG: hypothetical protein ABIP93_08135 [Gemmatimonadaceae bacterium]
MAQRDSRHHHANRRRKLEKDNSSRAQKNDELAERAPLAGYEELYEISRAGRVWSRKTRAVILGAYHHSPSIRITVNGAVVTLSKAKAVAESFAAKDAEIATTE